MQPHLFQKPSKTTNKKPFHSKMMNVFKSDINSGPTIDGSYAAGTVLAGLDTVYTQREMSTWHDTDSWRAALQANSS